MAERVTLPDCRAVGLPPLALTPAERRELVLRIATEGPDALDRWLREQEAAGDSTVAARLRRARDALLAQAEELKARLAGGLAERRREVERDREAALARLAGERADVEERLDRFRRAGASSLEAALRGSEVVSLVLDAPPPDRLPPAARFRRFLILLLRAILAPLRWLLGKLFPRARRRYEAKRVTFAAPAGAAWAADVEARAGAAYLANPALRRRVKERLRASPPAERARRAWERLLGREDYESIARRVAAEMLAEEAAAAQSRRSDEERRMSEDLARLAEEERERRAAAEGRLAELDREREVEAARLERELAEAPERTVKEDVLSELRASGLLAVKGSRIVPTLAFLDRFAAIVYEDEARAGAGKGSSAGAYAEGEGDFVRGPLRSHVEVAHMDVVGSVQRARMRHPRVRHMTEDDVLVYREERHAAQHVVVVVDRSGSMEEHGRMDAAKRAALALAHAVKAENPRNRVDFVEMSTGVRRVDAAGVWEAEPRGFTNTGAALRLAADLIRDAKSERGLVYLVTDGLPEAYTVDGEDVAGHPEKALRFALDEAKRLADVPGFGAFVCILLEATDPPFVKAAEAIARVLDGRVVKASPRDLVASLVREHAAAARAGAPRAR